jgi:hypothetical protein
MRREISWMLSPNFRLMFPIEDVPEWAALYPYEKDDIGAFEAAKRIRDGDFSRSNLQEIVNWKSEGRKALIAEHLDNEIRDALTLALEAKSSRWHPRFLRRWMRTPIP